MSDRHSKWVRVQPGTVIPAGQPYRAEWTEPQGPQAVERTSSNRQTAPPSPEWFVDSSWKPPLVLPTDVYSQLRNAFDHHDAPCGCIVHSGLAPFVCAVEASR